MTARDGAMLSATGPRPSGPYSQLIRVGDLLFTAGFGPHDREGRIPDGIGAQTEAVLDNLQAILEQAGSGLADVVKVTAHLADLADVAEYNAVYERRFQPPFPVRTTVGSQLAGFLVEIDVVATTSRKDRS